MGDEARDPLLGTYVATLSSGSGGAPRAAYWSRSIRIFHSSRRALVAVGIHGRALMVRYIGDALTS